VLNSGLQPMTDGILGYFMRAAAIAFVGPIVGGLIFVLLGPIVADADFKAAFYMGIGMLVLLPFFIIGCYIMGWKAALAAALVIALVGPHIPYRGALLIFAAIVGALATTLVTLDPDAKEVSDGLAFAMSLVGASSAAVCAWLLDRMKMMQRAPAPII
jgi:hypothetical protein